MFNKEVFENSIDMFCKMNTIALDMTKSSIDTLPEINNIIEKSTPAIKEMSESFQDWGKSITQNPKEYQENTSTLTKQLNQLHQYVLSKLSKDTNTEPVAKTEKNDPRFQHKDWNDNLYFDTMKQFYLLFSQWLLDSIKNQKDLDENKKNQILFHIKQLTSALSPSNFIFTNPEIIEQTVNQNGENLMRGFNHLLDDLKKGKGHLKISQCTKNKLKLGRNIAATQGQVIFENQYFQLIQYEPLSKIVYQTPILIVPPFINKYYILDINEEKSFVKSLIQQGFTVLIMSWVNPDAALRTTRFDDYVIEGVCKALNVIKNQLFVQEIHTIGYCVGGTLLATTGAYLNKKKKKTIKTMTLMATLTDFENIGELGVFISEKQITALESIMKEKGFFDDKHLFHTFNCLKPDELLWPFLTKNYLLGEPPDQFDILYWNEDGIRLPEILYSFYLREYYLNNKFSQNTLIIDQIKVGSKDIDCPIYSVASKADHIVPWQSCYTLHKKTKNNSIFTLTSGGHISIVAHKTNNVKMQYQSSSKKTFSSNEWQEKTNIKTGSWFFEWYDWLKKQSGKQKNAKPVNQYRRKIIEPAPGSYVKKTY